MALYIRDEQVYKDLHFLSRITGESLTEAARVAIRERLQHLSAKAELEVDKKSKKLRGFLAKRSKLKGANTDHKKLTDSLWEA